MNKELRNEIVEILKDGSFKISTIKLEKMRNMLSLDEHKETKLKQFLIEINIPEEVVELVIDTMLLRFKNLDKFCEYLDNRDIDLFDYLDKIVDLPKLFETRGIDPELIRWLMLLVWRTTPPAGIAEAAIAILFKGGRKPGNMEWGDAILGHNHIEVKGKRGCLIGPRAYGDGQSVGLYMSKKFSEYAGRQLSKDPGKYNFYKRNVWYVEELSTELILDGKMTSDDVADIIAGGLHLLYRQTKKWKIKKWVKDCINDVGRFDKEKFWEKFFLFSFKYYHKCEGYDYMVLANGDRILTFDPKHIRKNLKNIKIDGIPSWKGSSIQNKAFSITLR